MSMPELPPAIYGIRGGQMKAKQEGDQTRIWGTCVVLRQLWSVVVETNEIENFDPRSAMKIRESFPSIAENPDALEFLISGISPLGWQKTFAGEDDGFRDDHEGVR